MRIAIVSDIHANLTAFEAVLHDLRHTSPDLILHGGDLAGGGARPVEIVDQIRALGWPGVMGNTDEMLADPKSLEDFANNPPRLPALFAAIRESAEGEREALGEERLAWLGALPRTQFHGPLALVHASPDSPWRSPLPDASDAELESVYAPLGRPVADPGQFRELGDEPLDRRGVAQGTPFICRGAPGRAGLPHRVRRSLPRACSQPAPAPPGAPR